MMACTSPADIFRSRPFRICLPATVTWRFWISSILTFFLSGISTDAAFETDADKLLRFDGEFHGQLLQHFLAEAVDDQRYRVLRRQAALAAVEELILADLRGGRLVLDASGAVAAFDVRHGVGAALVADQQGVA